ncbi:acyl transferase/acyl hydrolase/lysophospholipase, partial [Trichophaea hybrida]
LPETPRPREVFDLIGGTSAGGLIAIMLGRLGMTIEDTIEAYKRISKSVFYKRPLGGRFGKTVLTLCGSPWYSAVKLENSVKDILQAAGVEVTAPLRGSHDPGCRMFVCATRAASSDSEMLRNYETTAIEQHDFLCTIIEAGMATAATPLLFPPVKLQQSGAVFVDGSLRRNSPIEEVINESDRIWPGPTIGCVISIGTGRSAQTAIDGSLSKLPGACIKAALGAQNKAEEFIKSRTGRELYESSKYFRFNVEEGLQHLKLDECRNFELIDASTVRYLKLSEVAAQITRCARSLASTDAQGTRPLLR